MTEEEALTILTEMQKWRRSEPPYDYDSPEDYKPMPYTPHQFGEALDVAIRVMKKHNTTTI